MGHYKNIAIDLMNQDMALEYIHNQYIKQLTESGLPLWMGDMYDNIQALYEEVESPTPENILDFHCFKESSTGLDYLAFWGNWEDAYTDYLTENNFFEQDPNPLPF
jgi:hypothetical protein